MAMMGWLNRLGGVIFYILIYLVIFSVLLFYATQLGIIKSSTMETSITYSFIEPIGPIMIGILGKVLPFFKDMFQELLHFFDAVSDKKSAA